MDTLVTIIKALLRLRLREGPGSALLLTMLIFSSMGCSFEKPSAPSWDTTLTVPLVSDTFTMEEIAKDESSISVGDDGLLNLELEEELDEYYVGDQLTVDNVQETMQVEVGAFRVDSPGAEVTTVSLTEIYDQAAVLNGQTLIVPGFNFVTDKKALDPYEDFTYAVIDSGSVFVTLTNNLAIALGSPVTTDLRDAITDTLIVSSVLNEIIPPGQSRVLRIDLQGKTLPNRIAVQLNGTSVGSQGAPVLIEANSSFEVESRIGDLEVREALAKIPQQVVSSAENLTMSDDIVVVEGTIDTGTISLNISDTFPLDAWVVYELPDFTTPSGTVTVDSLFIFKNTGASANIDLANHLFAPESAEFGDQKVRVLWTVRTIDTGDDLILLSKDNRIDVTVNLDNLRFQSVSGRLNEKEINITQTQFEFDIPTDLDSVFFSTATMQLTLNNGINFPLTTDFTIEGSNEAGSVVQLAVAKPIAAASQAGVPVTTVVTLDQDNSNVNEFLSILPSFIRVFGKVRVGDESTVGSITKDDFINGKVTISAPLAMRLPAQTIDTDPEHITIEEELRDDIIDKLTSGKIVIQLENHIPLGAALEIYFSQDEASIFENPTLKIGPLSVGGAAADASGFVQEALKEDLIISLNETEIQTFTNSQLFGGMRIFLDGTGGQVVKFRGSDFIKITSYGQFEFKVNQD